VNLFYIIENEDGKMVISNSQEIDNTLAGPFATVREAQQALKARRFRPLAWVLYVVALLLVLVSINGHIKNNDRDENRENVTERIAH
jgi:hypothetical protein